MTETTLAAYVVIEENDQPVQKVLLPYVPNISPQGTIIIQVDRRGMYGDVLLHLERVVVYLWGTELPIETESESDFLRSIADTLDDADDAARLRSIASGLEEAAE